MLDRTSSFLVGGLVAIVAVALLVLTDVADPFDAGIIGLVRDPARESLLSFLGPVTELGSTRAVTAVAVVTLVLGFTVAPWRHGVLGAATIGIAALGVQLVKAVVARDRPDALDPLIVERGFSFPSGHASLSMVAYGILAVLLARAFLPGSVRIFLIAAVGVLVFLVGLSRVWLGAHYPTDVIAGWLIGGVVVELFALFTRAVSTEPAAEAADAGPGAPRSDRPAGG